MGRTTTDRAVEAIARLASEGYDLVSFWRRCTSVLERAVPHWGGPCWYTLDPDSLLMTSHVNEVVTELPAELLAAEYGADDPMALTTIARSERGVATLHEVTGGDPSSSPRWHDNLALGGDQELIAALRASDGEVWGAVGLYREPGAPLFTDADVELVRAVAPHLAEGARRALLVGEAVDPDHPDAPGLLVLTAEGVVVSRTPDAARWVAELPDGDLDSGRLPTAVLAVSSAVLRPPDGARPDPSTTSVRVRTRSGRWAALHASRLEGAEGRRAAVIIEAADPSRVAPLLMSAYRLTERERDVTRLVLRGTSTSQIAGQLHLSPHTVQQHLKAVFDKTGVRSRRDLVAEVFFAHFEPRVRDNERRAVAGEPLRGGPLSAVDRNVGRSA
jgi:DNA-binding CsgD family transcriptional regulator